MPNMKWSELTKMQLGKYGEYYAKMEFSSYCYEIYTSEVDDHGVDFVAKNPNTGKYFEIQVKSIMKSNYVFMQKAKHILDENHLVCLLKFTDNNLPDVYVIPATVWNTPNALFRDYDNTNEWGINISKANTGLLEPYRIENVLSNKDT